MASPGSKLPGWGERAIADQDETSVIASSESLGWEGFHLEVVTRNGWHVDETTVSGHMLAINLDDSDLHFETRADSDWRQARLPPDTLWIIPEGWPFSVHSSTDSRYARCIIDGRYLDSLTGCHFELEAGIGVADPVLAQLIRVLVAILDDKAQYSQVLASELIRSMVSALAVRHGHPAPELKSKGGIAPEQMKALDAWLQAHVQNTLTVGLMAAQVGLSNAHFSREFKRSTGVTPWEYVVRLRLDGARAALLRGISATNAASQFGFSDQSHLSRLFKLRFGSTPAAFVKKNP